MTEAELLAPIVSSTEIQQPKPGSHSEINSDFT